MRQGKAARSIVTANKREGGEGRQGGKNRSQNICLKRVSNLLVQEAYFI